MKRILFWLRVGIFVCSPLFLCAQWTEIQNFGTNPGQLKMFYYTHFQTEELPLVVVLHGCSQTAHTIAEQSGWNELAAKHRFRVLYPEQRLLNNPSLCFNWFKQNDIIRDKGEIQSIAEMIAYMKQMYPTTQVFVYGVSAGAAMGTALMAQYPELFQAGAIVAGGPYMGGVSMFSSLRSMIKPIQRTPKEWTTWADTTKIYPKIIILQGTSDPVVHWTNAFEIIKQWSVLQHCDTIPELTILHFENFPFITVKIYENTAGKEVIKWYILEGKGHYLLVNPGDKEKEGGKIGLFAKDFDFFSTWYIAQDFGLIR